MARSVEVRVEATGVTAVQAALSQLSGAIKRMSDEMGVGAETGARKLQLVKDGMSQVRAETEAVSGSAIYGLAELSRGISRVAETGTASSMAMRELAGGVMRLGASLGPGAGLIGVFLLLGGTIASVFMHARQEAEKTAETFNRTLGQLANAGESGKLQKQIRDIQWGTPYDEKGQLQNPSGGVRGAFQGSILDLQNRIQMLRDKLLPSGYLANDVANQPILKSIQELQAQLDPLLDKVRRLSDAALNVASQPAGNAFGLQAGMKITARGRYTGPDEFSEGDSRFLEQIRKGQLADYFRDDVKGPLDALGVQAMPVAIGGAFGDAEIGGANLLDPFFGRHGDDKIAAPKLGKIVKTAYDQLAEESAKQQESFGSRIATQITDTFGGAIATGMRSAFQAGNIGAGFAAFGKSVLAGLGSVFVEIGEHALIGLAFMKAISDAIIAWNPIAGAAAAIGLIALGSAMEAAASGASHSMAHYGGSSAVGAYAAGSAPSITDPRTIGTASGITTAPTVHNHITIFGKDDPRAQRELAEMMARTARRGTTSG